MATSDIAVRPAPARGNVVLTVGLRIVGAVLLVGMAWIHYHLWGIGYNTVSLIGPLFLVNAIVGALLAIAVLAVPGRMLGITATLSSLFTLGTLAALLVSLFWGLFGFKESIGAPLLKTTLVVEGAGVIILAILGALAARGDGMWQWLPTSSDPANA
ncbi:MAG TPA: hypothetical protein VFX16_01110 [Pseudonocardiaceae bacterium]|nr:hypothetical protein [Pseudonocardiaceae bacterium]